MNHISTKAALAITCSLLTIACGDTTSGVGELGRIDYKISTSYIVDEGDLRDVEIVTGHTQLFSTDLTEDGEDDANSPGKLKHRVRPSDGTEISQVGGGDGEPPSFEITVDKAGSYTLETMEGDDVFDYIELAFDKPTKLSLVTWTRGPDEDDWSKQSGSGTVKAEPGTQATFLPIPLSESGDRLVGDIKTELSATPESAVVEGKNVVLVYEQRVVSNRSPLTIYFLESADVTIEIADLVNETSGSRDFKVRD